ncbi:hypothetical protein [Paenimyroides aestuarii]|uniref:Uncharacterized protein n=1 Tax=Paenimyroides aestuarii TaxID=2968490 RepID=A0ABY5NVB5_9FLAO|nr:hypothetical protein [Paenimyroides aestuarii]UUV22289.1 hypothetical protein NPX36_04435 [Paenimyroides aestuarii]
MKKSIIALMGLFALVACSEDSYQQADKMSETGSVETGSGGMQTNSVDSDVPGHTTPGIPNNSGNYESPYLTPAGTLSPKYHFINNTSNTIVITPSVGFYVWGQPVDPYYGNYLSNPANYPNLFAGGNKYGNTVDLDPIILHPGTSLMHGPATGGLPINGATMGTGFSYSSSLITTNEVLAMMEIGKMHHLTYSIYPRNADPKSVPPFTKGMLKQKVGPDTWDFTMFPNHWKNIVPLSIHPDLMFIANLRDDPTRGELCLTNSPNKPIVPSEVSITDPFGATHTLSYVTDLTDIYVIYQ